MAEKARYPQIPSTVWWGVHSILNKTPSATLDDRFLSVHLNVQPVAAKQYIAELISVGILNDEFKATPLAMKWRIDATYPEAVKELLSKTYPKGLLDLAPPSEGDRQKAIDWFLQEGMGRGTATNKAATYLMLGSPTSNEAPGRSASSRKSKDDSKQNKTSTHRVTTAAKTKVGPRAKSVSSGTNGDNRNENIPLNVNVQIHISADAGTDQIESIFSAMRRYLYDKQNS